MIRVRIPGGFCTAEQWIAMDDICQNFANGTLKITTRQTWQVHGVLKRDVKKTMRAMNKARFSAWQAQKPSLFGPWAPTFPSIFDDFFMDF